MQKEQEKMKNRAREAGISLPGNPGKYNAITDVPGVEVGYATIFEERINPNSKGGFIHIRTGVTAILPRGKKRSAVFGGRHDLNGNGELTGTHWVDDSGFIHGPIMLTNTNSVGIVRDATSRWMIENNLYYPLVHEGQELEGFGYFYPVVGETWDGILNDVNGFHVKEEHVREALGNARSGAIREGSVGGGTGMVCHEFKGGGGTSSRVLSEEEGGYTVGTLVQANHGTMKSFEIKSVNIGELIEGCDPEYNTLRPSPGTGSIVAIVATDAEVLPWQLSKMCKRVSIGIGKLGAGYENGSGDIFLAFSTANPQAYSTTVSEISLLSDDMMNPIYKAVAETVEEAILNALFAGETTIGRGMNKVYGLPQEQVIELLNK